MVKNILIFSVSIGAGHNSAARSLEEEIKSKIHDSKTKIIDTFDYINPILHKVVLGSYMETLKFNPHVWGYLYRQAEDGERIVDLGQILNKLLSHRLHQLIDEFRPDAIICTHAFPAGMISVLKEKTGLKVPVFVVLTDFTVHAFWIHPYIDYYIIPSDKLIHESILKGMNREKIKPFGIPIKKDFRLVLDKKAAKRKIGLDERKTILVMGGGLGLGAVKDTVKTLLNTVEGIQIVAVTGKNQKLFAKLQELENAPKNLHVFGYVDNVMELMTAADLIITKPGGLTTAEVLAKGLPMVIVDPLPGQEDRNTEFLLNWGVAVKARQHALLPTLISQLFSCDLRMHQMKEMASYLAKPWAARDIIEFIMDRSSPR